MPAYDSHALSLYCDAEDQHQAYRPGECFPAVFYHPEPKRCRQLAKQAGWKFTKHGLLCPRCVTNHVKLPRRQK